jgi:hypothetical protein
MVNGIGGPTGPGAPNNAGPPSRPDPNPPSNPNDPWNLRRLINQGSGSSDREKKWVAEQTALLGKLEKMTDVERAFEWSLMDAHGESGEVERQMRMFNFMSDKSPEYRQASLTKEFQDMESKSITSIFKAQFNSLIMQNLKNVEEAIKK